MRTPLLILSDAPTAGTGLARITRDLAVRIAEHLPEFEVATLGCFGSSSRKLPFHQYDTEMKDWLVLNLEEVWRDFAGDAKGIALTVWDASRMMWFSRPENCADPHLRKFLTKPPFERWGYFPTDATGPGDRLTAVLGHIIGGYDRGLAYSSWAEGVLRRTLAIRRPILEGLSYLPHGIESSVFYPRDRHAARHNFGERNKLAVGNGKWLNVPDDALMIGAVATNQVRKDWGLAVATVAEIKKHRKVFFWAHTDVTVRCWSIMDMLNDFDLLSDSVVTSLEFTDEQMAWNYSGCDVTLAIGLGEGFGYSAAESLACGTPAVAPNYGGGEFIPQDFLVEPVAWRLEGVYNCVRPVMSPTDFAHKAKEAGEAKKLMTGSLLPSRYEWPNLWHEWAEWLKAGVK